MPQRIDMRAPFAQAAGMLDPSIRSARGSDLPRLLEIYNHYVVHTPVTFDIEAVTLAARGAWLAQFAPTGRHQLLVAEHDGKLLGYATSQQFRVKPAYDATVETSVYCAPESIGQGIGRALYAALFSALEPEDVHCYVACITLPNDASVQLHARFGFAQVGTMREVGRKLGRYWDVGWYQKRAHAT